MYMFYLKEDISLVNEISLKFETLLEVDTGWFNVCTGVHASE